MPAAVSMIPVLFDLRRILCCAYHISDAVSRAFSRSSALHLLRYLDDSNKRVPYCAVHIISRRNLEKRTQKRPFSVCVNLKKDTPRRSKGKKNILIKEWFISCQASLILLLKSQINYFYSSALYRRSIVHWGACFEIGGCQYRLRKLSTHPASHSDEKICTPRRTGP